MAAPLLGVLVPQHGGAVALVATAGAVVHAVVDGEISVETEGYGLLLTAADGTAWTYEGVKLTTGGLAGVRAGQQIGIVAEGPYLVLSATAAGGSRLDVAALLIGLPDAAACASDEIEPDPDDLDGPMAADPGAP